MSACAHLFIRSRIPRPQAYLSVGIKWNELITRIYICDGAPKASATYRLGYSIRILGVFARRTTAVDESRRLLPHRTSSSFLDIGSGPESTTTGSIDSPRSQSMDVPFWHQYLSESLSGARVDGFKANAPRDAARFLVRPDLIPRGRRIQWIDGTARSMTVIKEINRVLKLGDISATRDVRPYHWFQIHTPQEK